jgi:hypothetical protein
MTDFTRDEASEVRLAMQDRIIYLLSLGLVDDARTSYSIYRKVDGYDDVFRPEDLEKLGAKEK